MNILHACILSIIEGITEFLPISSTGHLILAGKLLGIDQTEFVKSFEIIIQLGSILAIVCLFWKKIISENKLIKPILISFIPTATIGYILFKFIKQYLIGNENIVIISLFIGGLLIFILESFFKKQKENIQTIDQLNIQKLVIIGLFQTLSIIPGVSRSLASIYGGLFMGLSKKDAVFFSFLLAIPTMFAATGLDLIKSGFSFSQSEWIVLGIGLVLSFFTAFVVVKWFIQYIQNHSFVPFGIYRIIIALIFVLYRG
jgi:undecaprenyl-diphosphatase